MSQLDLRNARQVLSNYGTVLDQESGELVRFDPAKICPQMANGILDFIDSDRRTPTGHRKMQAVLGPRQCGKSLVAALGGLVYVNSHPSAYAAIFADNKDRAIDLFRTINTCYEHMPDGVKTHTGGKTEVRQLTLETMAKIKTLSMEASMAGIGRAFDYLHMSELPFAKDAAETWNGILPAIINRKEAIVLLESTPAPMTLPSASWYRDICAEARRGIGRWEFLFVPFFQSRLNERNWNPSWHLTNEEVGLLQQFGGERVSGKGLPYLTVENLAFRREILDMDPEVRRYPELFKVYYPFDPITCWAQASGSAIPSHVLDPHREREVVPWDPDHEGLQRYGEPKPGAVYIIGVDPAGWMGNDPACIQVLELWEDRWEQVAVLESNKVDPPSLSKIIVRLAREYNDAEVIVESNGVGMGVIAMLYEAFQRGDLRKLYCHGSRGIGKSKPGIPASTKTIQEALGRLIDSLMDRLVINDQETLDQLSSYRNDKLVEDSAASEILRPGKLTKGRRASHHWDRVSALLWAVYGAYSQPVRFRPLTLREDHGEVVPEDPTTWTDDLWKAKRRAEAEDKRKSKQGSKRRKPSRNKPKLRRPKRKYWSS